MSIQQPAKTNAKDGQNTVTTQPSQQRSSTATEALKFYDTWINEPQVVRSGPFTYTTNRTYDVVPYTFPLPSLQRAIEADFKRNMCYLNNTNATWQTSKSKNPELTFQTYEKVMDGRAKSNKMELAMMMGIACHAREKLEARVREWEGVEKAMMRNVRVVEVLMEKIGELEEGFGGELDKKQEDVCSKGEEVDEMDVAG